jgi:hypothetical protein
MLDLLRAAGVFDRDPFVLIDAGCRGGIEKCWRRFGQTLIAHAFDPVIEECERLAAAETFPNVHYHAAFLGLPASDPFAARSAATCEPLNPWSRLSTSRAISILSEPVSAAGPQDAPRRLADETRIGIAEFAANEALPPVDFVKIDVDGADYEVLRSAEPLLRAGQVLGISIEVNYWGAQRHTANTFHNIDRYLRGEGFALFALDWRPYSRVDLPAPFLKRFPAQTAFGAPLQGDAVYFRDLAAPHQHELAASLPAAALPKLAAMYEVFGLPDCAAEIINTFRDRFGPPLDPVALLDALAGAITNPAIPYAEYLKRFEADPTSFYPADAGAEPLAPARDDAKDALAERVRALERELHEARRDSVRLGRELERAEARAALLLESRDRLKARVRGSK